MEMQFDADSSTKLVKHFANLHVPGEPLLVTNIWDVPSLNLALSNSRTVAIATASFAIAATHGFEDEELDAETNLAAILRIRKAFIKSGKHATIPFSTDIQDGYASTTDLESLGKFIQSIVRLGVVGVNIEDVVRSPSNGPGSIEEVLISGDQMASRIRTIIEVARTLGVEGFVVNARTDCVKLGGTIEEVIVRGKKFLEAGATTVFVWGGTRGLRDQEVSQLVKGLDGKVAVIHKRGEGFLSVKEIKNLGVARISMGPGLWREGMAAVKSAMDVTLEGHLEI